MRILHTSDWHVGRGIRGRSRAHEHRAALAEIADVAAREQVDIVLVAGDQFDTAAPSPESEAIVYRALLDLEATGAQVVVLAGNHDNPRRWGAVKPLFEQRGFHLVDELRRPDDGGVLDLTTDGGEVARIGAIPWLSQTAVVKSRQLMELGSGTQSAMYGDWVKRIIDVLSAGFSDDVVNVLTGHLTVAGSPPPRGTGERPAHLIFDYLVSPAAFPATAQYVALGHLHRPHRLESPCANVWYCGSPLMLDFGEAESDHKEVLVVEVEVGKPADVHRVPLAAGTPLRTLRGSLAQVEAMADRATDAHVRVELDEAPAPGLADRVREMVPNAVAIEIAPSHRENPDEDVDQDMSSVHSTPTDLLREYLESEGTDRKAIDDLVALMTEVMEELDAADAA